VIKIKPLSHFTGQIPALADLWISLVGVKHFPDINREFIETQLRASLMSNILPLSYIAVDDDTAIGMASLSSEAFLPGYNISPWIRGVCIDPAYASRGIGKLLVNTMKSEAFKLGFKDLWRMSFDEETTNWFENLGWDKQESATLNGHNIDIMKIKLSYNNLL
jgi:GNAT superfamily N-acetyltransferase